MKVNEIMTAEPRTCTPDMSVAAAARQMWEADCGILPVVQDGKLVGVVTDRDMYIALATRNQRPSDLPVGEVASTVVITCGPDDDVKTALGQMKRAMVRRLPVVDAGGSVVGIISTDDLVRVAGPRKAVRNDDVIDTLQAIFGQHQPVRVTAA